VSGNQADVVTRVGASLQTSRTLINLCHRSFSSAAGITPAQGFRLRLFRDARCPHANGDHPSVGDPAKSLGVNLYASSRNPAIAYSKGEPVSVAEDIHVAAASPSTRLTGAELTDLVSAARNGEGAAWATLVERFGPLVFSVTRKFRLSPADCEDVSQVVWLRLWEHMDGLREPKALPGWIVVTTRHEALRVIGMHRRTYEVDPSVLSVLDLDDGGQDVDESLLGRERTSAVRDGLAELGPGQRRLLLLLHAEPRPSYHQIGALLGMPVGSIGPSRARYIEKLRTTRAIRNFLEDTEPEYLSTA